MAGKVKVIIKRPDEEYGHVCHISHKLKNLQKTVEGYIEIVPITKSPDGKPIMLICNEEGKIRGLKPNMRIIKPIINYKDKDEIINLKHNMHIGSDVIVGTIIICSAEGEDLTDLPATYGLAEWKQFVDENRR